MTVHILAGWLAGSWQYKKKDLVDAVLFFVRFLKSTDSERFLPPSIRCAVAKEVTPRDDFLCFYISYYTSTVVSFEQRILRNNIYLRQPEAHPRHCEDAKSGLLLFFFFSGGFPENSFVPWGRIFVIFYDSLSWT